MAAQATAKAKTKAMAASSRAALSETVAVQAKAMATECPGLHLPGTGETEPGNVGPRPTTRIKAPPTTLPAPSNPTQMVPPFRYPPTTQAKASLPQQPAPPMQTPSTTPTLDLGSHSGHSAPGNPDGLLLPVGTDSNSDSGSGPLPLCSSRTP